jgi:uncharacterized protein YecE (DUF72 family)
MKFGSVNNPDEIDFSLPADHPETSKLLSKFGNQELPAVYVGCAKWNPKDLQSLYPKGTGDKLKYYSRQFNSVELNATFYNTFDEDQIRDWCSRVPESFRFFPKVNRYISHLKWLNDIESAVDDYYNSIIHFEENLGTIFLQLRGKFAPKYFNRVQNFIEYWPGELPLAIEFRHPDWFGDEEIAADLYALLEEHNVANVITDTAGRRDLLHMRPTNNEVFIRYVGANHKTDVTRLDDWVDRLALWTEQGLDNIHFFVHQNKEKKSPELAAHFIKKLNDKLGTNLNTPNIGGNGSDQGDLF